VLRWFADAHLIHDIGLDQFIKEQHTVAQIISWDINISDEKSIFICYATVYNVIVK